MKAFAVVVLFVILAVFGYFYFWPMFKPVDELALAKERTAQLDAQAQSDKAQADQAQANGQARSIEAVADVAMTSIRLNALEIILIIVLLFVVVLIVIGVFVYDHFRKKPKYPRVVMLIPRLPGYEAPILLPRWKPGRFTSEEWIKRLQEYERNNRR